MDKNKLTDFGIFLERRAISKAKLGELTGITRQRLSELSIRAHAKIKFDEACYISKALNISLDDLAKELVYIEESI